ncbi:MAG: glycerophosphodiester phosphodiesterase [Spirochaetota bacterium]
MGKKVMVLGHRGYRIKFPENTLLSFNKAFEYGADGIECDIQKTKDGKYVIIHDETVDRTAKDRKKGFVEKMTLKQLKGIDLGKKQSIPELHEFLKSLPGDKYINIELKSETLRPQDCPGLCGIFLEYIKKENLMVSSFEHTLLPYFKAQKITIGYLIGEENQHLGVKGILRIVRAMKPQYMNMPVQMFEQVGMKSSRILLMILRLMGSRISFWTVNSQEEFDLAYRFGDVIITDQVEFVLDQVSKKSR